MRLVIHGHGVEIAADLSTRITRHVVCALGMLSERLGLVTIRLTQAAGASGVTSCCMAVDLLPRGGLAVVEAGPDMDAVVERAAERVCRATRRELLRRGDRPFRPQAGAYALVAS